MTASALPYSINQSLNDRPDLAAIARQIPQWALLAIGATLMPLATLKWNLAPLAWVAPVPFLLYMRRPAPGWAHRFALLGALLVASNLMTLKLFTEPVPWMIVPGYGVPIALALWCVYLLWGHIHKTAGERWSLYAFPALMALTETIGYRLTEFGVWGAAVNTQLDDLRLLQFASVFGVAGIGFLVAWVASMFAALIASSNRHQFRPHIAAILVALISVYSYGSLRLFAEQKGPTVRVAGIVADLGPSPTGLPDAASVVHNTEQLFARSEIAASRGARVIVWNEAATVVEAADESLFVRRGAEFARRREVDLVLAYIVPLSNSAYRMENKYVWFGEDGTILETYYKHHPVPGEGSVKGSDPLRVMDRPYARVSGAICYDYDFPSMALQHSRLGAGLVAVPSSDWRGIDPYHTQMARVRAIEGGFSVLRPVRWATSGAFDAFGRSRASLSHFEENDRIIEATLPTTQVATLYSRIGDSAVFGYILILLGAVTTTARRRMSRYAGALVVLATLSACAENPVAPNEPAPIPKPEIAGSIYVLQQVDGSGPPFLTSDQTYASDGTRIRFWLLADTIRFGLDGSLGRHRAHRQLDETPGYPDVSDEWTSYSSGTYNLENDRILIAWGSTIVSVPVFSRDTLNVHPNRLSLRVKRAAPCGDCNDGSTVEYLYVRR